MCCAPCFVDVWLSLLLMPGVRGRPPSSPTDESGGARTHPPVVVKAQTQTTQLRRYCIQAGRSYDHRGHAKILDQYHPGQVDNSAVIGTTKDNIVNNFQNPRQI